MKISVWLFPTEEILIFKPFFKNIQCHSSYVVKILEFDRVYDGMLGAPISAENLIIGEIIFAGTKGFFFSIAVLAVVWGFGIITHPLSILSAFAGLLTGLMFATASIYITSFIKNIKDFFILSSIIFWKG